jgi:3'-phosphoadenosine 5'-phosphosulfate sulfotransferase (PAPS reductase)/FAD synthetase
MKRHINVIRDINCYPDMPLVHGHPDSPIYGASEIIRPKYIGKNESEYERKIFLPELLPLEEYDQIVVLYSGGKDSTASYLKLIELGVPKEKIELWHHDIDGGHPERRMDWPVTQAYVKAFAEAEGVKLRVSYRENGFFGEMYRIGASYPVWYEDDGEFVSCPLSKQQTESENLRQSRPQFVGI